jgi:eukaryotic-like serine/threonine-protein kinase
MTSRWMGEYEIVSRLRVGGMATLYLARRHGAAGFSRLVALKVVHPHLVELPAVIEMFVDEARICSQISHPHVVHVEEFGVIDGVHYLVMEYLDGCSISDLLQVFQRQGRMLDPELAARVILEVAGGLHAAHETRDAEGRLLDIVHRDISPSNVLLSTDGNAKLIDFGIAKARNRISETEAGVSLKGKYNYVAPEQATRAGSDRRSDVFSLGVVFWEMLVGQPLFAEDTYLALFHRLHRTDVAAPSTVNRSVPAALDPIVLAMLQHDPADRPQTAAEVVRRIAAAMPGAANREASELGAIAIEVRDERAMRCAFDDPERDGDVPFSPTPRAGRTHSEEYRLKLEARSASSPYLAIPMGSAPPLPVWRRRGAQLGTLAAVAVVTLGMVFAQRTAAPRPPAPASAPVEAVAPAAAGPGAPRPSITPLSQVAASTPASAPSTPASAPSAPSASVSAPPVPSSVPSGGAAPELAQPAAPVPSPGLAPPAAAPVAPAAPAAQIAASAAASPATPAAPAARHEPPRVVVKPRPMRRPATEPDVARPVAPSRTTAIHDGNAPFVDVPFDDSDNTGAPPATAPNLTRTKKAPIAPDFGN